MPPHLTRLRQLGLNPVACVECRLDDPAHQRVQFVKCQWLALHALSFSVLFVQTHLIGFPEIGNAISKDVVGVIGTICRLPYKLHDFRCRLVGQRLPQASHQAASDRRGKRSAVGMCHQALSIDNGAVTTHCHHIGFHTSVVGPTLLNVVFVLSGARAPTVRTS